MVLNQPSVVAMDTRKNTVLEAGDKALAMVGDVYKRQGIRSLSSNGRTMMN